MDVPSHLKPVYMHWRVRSVNGSAPSSGKPPNDLMLRYTRGEGFCVFGHGDRIVGYRDECPHPYGGGTVCSLYDKETGELVTQGRSICSMADPFNYGIGRRIALGRALANLR